jgi:hypothetical protein
MKPARTRSAGRCALCTTRSPFNDTLMRSSFTVISNAFQYPCEPFGLNAFAAQLVAGASPYTAPVLCKLLHLHAGWSASALHALLCECANAGSPLRIRDYASPPTVSSGRRLDCLLLSAWERGQDESTADLRSLWGGLRPRERGGIAMTARTVRGVLYAALLATLAVAAAPVAQAEPSSDANTVLSGIARSSRERRWLR